jgi:ABC-type dipeptide/oligopeptide/nickel transport system permease subunit
MTRKLDWKWIAIGVLIMVALNIAAGFVLALALGPEVQGATNVEDITLSGGQVALVAVVNFLSFVIGGFIVGLKSVGRTILEPGLSAAIAVVIALLISGHFTVVNMVVGGLIPFVAGVIGGWLGERRQGMAERS